VLEVFNQACNALMVQALMDFMWNDLDKLLLISDKLLMKILANLENLRSCYVGLKPMGFQAF
jgi:hypothetical protein